VINRVSQVFTVDSFRVEEKDPLVVRILYAPRRDATMLDPTPLAASFAKKWNSGSALTLRPA
jgi:hypothetical protein